MRKPTNKPKGKSSTKDKFTASEVGTLVDQFRSEFKIFGERQEAIITKLDATHEQVGRNTERLIILETAIRKNTEKLERLTERVDKNTEAIAVLSQKVDKNTEAIAILSQKLEGLTKSIDNLAKTKLDRQEFQTLDKRVSILEAKVASLSR